MRQADAPVHRDIKRSAANFLKTDVKVGLTFAKIALQTRDHARQQRNRTRARVAYSTVVRHVESVSEMDQGEIGSGLAELRTALELLGESFESENSTRDKPRAHGRAEKEVGAKLRERSGGGG